MAFFYYLYRRVKNHFGTLRRGNLMARGGKYLESNFGISFVKKERRKKTCHFNSDSNMFLV